MFSDIVPFNFVRIGTDPGLFPRDRGAIADFEVLAYNERIPAWRLGNRLARLTRGVAYYMPWQGFPIESTLDDQSYIIGNELLIPFEEPDTNRFVYKMGVEALAPDWTNLWYHRSRNGDRLDAKDGWRLGRPDNSLMGPQGAPPTAYRGRWVYGTMLKGQYPNDAIMDLYSPIFNLSLPPANAIYSDNANSFHLVYNEWLDLADSNDFVRVDVIRPGSPADVLTRVSATNKPPLIIVGDRNYAFNTTGQWRRVVAPLNVVANEDNLYIRFSLHSDSNNAAGGWYIDNVAIVQGGEISGTYANTTNGTKVDLKGIQGDMIIDSTVVQDGQFFFGLLPSGLYSLFGTNFFFIGGGNWNDSVDVTGPVEFTLTGIGLSSVVVRWQAITNQTYRIQYAPSAFGPWTNFAPDVVATNDPMSYVDILPAGTQRFYRVWLLNQP
jgi:hypothetical protein